MNLRERYRLYKFNKWAIKALPNLSKMAGENFDTYEQWQEWYCKQSFVDKFWRIHVDRGTHVAPCGAPIIYDGTNQHGGHLHRVGETDNTVYSRACKEIDYL